MTKSEKRRKEQRYLERRANELKQAGTEKAIRVLQLLPLYILAHEFGFGNKRLMRFLEKMYRYTDKVQNDIHILEIIQDELEHDKKIRIDIQTGEVENLRTKKTVRLK